METNEAIEPVPTTENEDPLAFPIVVGELFIAGAAITAGLYGGKLLIEWIADRFVFPRRRVSVPETPDND